MALPLYTTDLQDVTTCESNAGWIELTGHTAGQADAQEDEYWIQGSFCVSQGLGQAILQTAGLEFDYGSDITLNAGEVFFIWQTFIAPNAIDTFANMGMSFGIGSSSGNMDFFTTMGNDYKKYPYGGWQNSAVDPLFTTPDLTDGTPLGTYRHFGSLPNILSKVSKGSPHAIDAIRWGRGEIKIEHGEVGNYGNLEDISLDNDGQLNRWGLLQKDGENYLWKGLLSFGNTTNPCDFRDANRTITADDVPRTYAGFNKIEVRNANSNVEWTAYTISAGGILSKGSFEIIDDGATVRHTSCTFNDQSTYKYGSNATVLNTTHRRCELVSQLGGTFTGGVFDEPSGLVGLLSDNLNLITNSVFNSDGTGHAVDLGTISSTQSVIWDNVDSGYTDASNGNETIVVSVDTGIILTINVATGASTPTVYNTGLGTVNVVSGSVTINVNVKDQLSQNINGALVYIDEDLDTAGSIINTTTDVNGNVSTSYSGVATTATIRVRLYGCKPSVSVISLLSDSNTNVILITDPQQT